MSDVSFTLQAGEILGLAGLMGSGRTELARALFGIDRLTRGEIPIRGQQVNAVQTRDEAIAAGLALIPEDRREQGLVLDHSVRENLLLPLLGRIAERPLLLDRRPGTSAVRRPDRAVRGQGRAPRTGRSGCSPAATSRRSCWPSGWAPTPTC